MKSETKQTTQKQINLRSWEGFERIGPNRPSSYMVVSAGGITKGNHRDPNSWSYSVTRYRNWVGKFRTYYPALPAYDTSAANEACYHHTPWYDGPGAPPWDQRNFCYNSALAKLNGKIRGSLDLGVSLAEAGQTLKMLKALARIRELVLQHGMKLGDTGDVANGLLLYEYGWKPLLSDLFGILNEMLNTSFNGLKRFSARHEVPIVDWPEAPATRYVYQNSWKMKAKGKGVQGCRFVIYFETTGGFDAARWSSLNPLNLGWELIPYSFVIDWFYNVGGFLRAAETAILYDARFKSGYVSELYAYKGTEELEPGQRIPYWSNSPLKFEQCDGARSSIKAIQFVRTKLTSYPLPRAPSFRCDLGDEQLFSLAALLRQLL